ncbi:MAG: restriction endonuclease subunit S [Methylococcaceae bacterium]|nr:restriction endonuclease subunit S [Methylococcaceae bacterium]
MKLKEISKLSAGHPFRGKIPEVKNSGVIAIQMKNLSIDSGIDWNSCVETEVTSKRGFKCLKEGDILFTARGDNNFAVTIDKTPDNKQVVAAPQFHVLSSIHEDVMPEYLAWLLNQKHCQRYFQREAAGSLTKSLRIKTLEDTPITVPSLKKQKTIVKLSNTLKQEQKILKQIIHNGEITMNAIANDLFASERETVKEKN